MSTFQTLSSLVSALAGAGHTVIFRDDIDPDNPPAGAHLIVDLISDTPDVQWDGIIDETMRVQLTSVAPTFLQAVQPLERAGTATLALQALHWEAQQLVDLSPASRRAAAARDYRKPH